MIGFLVAKNLYQFLLLVILIQTILCLDLDSEILYTTEAFYTPIWFNNKYINTSSSEANDNHYFEALPSLSGHAALPSWIRYFQRPRSNVGYLYGTPPLNEDGDLELDVIILNKYNFNTTRERIKYRILNREEIYNYEIEMKLFDLDIHDFFQKNLTAIIKEIFSTKLWNSEKQLLTKEHQKNDNSSAIYLTRVARPIDVGGRFPLDPNEKECVVIKIGNIANYTEELIRLETEIKQIRNLDPCPKQYKAATVEYIFREKKLHVDWCSFKLLNY